jgi:hypothetical protein
MAAGSVQLASDWALEENAHIHGKEKKKRVEGG